MDACRAHCRKDGLDIQATDAFNKTVAAEDNLVIMSRATGSYLPVLANHVLLQKNMTSITLKKIIKEISALTWELSFADPAIGDLQYDKPV